MRNNFRLIALLPFVTLLSACSDHQQDYLLSIVTEIGRNKANVIEKTVHAADVEIRYLERIGEGPTVMLIHGFSANKDSWLQFISHLPKHWHIVAPDLAGHGNTSTPTDGNYQLMRQAERLHAFSKALQLPPFHIIGSSMGGGISALYAASYSNSIKSLTLLDAAGVDEPNPSEFTQAFMQGRNVLIATDKDGFEKRWNMVMSKPPYVPWPLRSAMIRQTLERANINNDIFNGMLGSRKNLGAGQFDKLLKEHVLMPVLIMWGADDKIIDVSAAHAFKERLPHAQLEIFAGVGHLPQIEISKQSALRFAAFISSL